MKEATRGLLAQVYFAFCKGADTPVSLGMWLRFKYGEFEQLVRKDVAPSDYTDGTSFEKDYAVVKYLSKYKDLDTGINLDEVSLQAWRQAEQSCAETNRRIRSSRHRGTNPRVEAVLFTARRKIAECLGEFRIATALDGCKWGPGSTFSLKGENATLDDKMREYPLTVTKRAMPYFKAVVESDPHWGTVVLSGDKLPGDPSCPEVVGPFSLLQRCFTAVPGCRATLVAKSAKTHRSIAIEPTGNIFLQLGIGRLLRRRLRRVGIDLNDQTRNQRLAYEGSLTGELATIDLAAASDTVSKELVYELLPLDLVLLLDQVRSPKISWKKGDWLELEKFSSMGNGFTFELESLIFWGLTSATLEVSRVRGQVGIFGDDIICPTECVPLLREVLAFCGFSVNLEKSHERGYFRESCGRHYWNGRDVTPVYQKEIPDNIPESYRLANRLFRYGNSSGLGVFAGRDRYWVLASWHASVNGVAEFFGYLGNQSLFKHQTVIPGEDQIFYWMSRRGAHAVPCRDVSDDGLLLPYKWLEYFVLQRDRDGRIQLPVLSFRPKRKTADGRVLLAYWLRFSPDTASDGRVAVRRRGRYVSRRRWFSSFMFVSSPAALDVAW